MPCDPKVQPCPPASHFSIILLYLCSFLCLMFLVQPSHLGPTCWKATILSPTMALAQNYYKAASSFSGTHRMKAQRTPQILREQVPELLF